LIVWWLCQGAAGAGQAAPEEEALLAPHQAAARALVEQEALERPPLAPERQPVPPAAPARRDCILHIGPCGPQAEKPP